jgi:hypothetical protein
MSKTAQLELPLVAPAQAQKHITVNEALSRLDAVAQLRVVSSAIASPPAAVQDGASYLVPAGAGADWAGMDGRIAVRANGAWVFLTPRAGWRAWDESRYGCLCYDGTDWVADALVTSPHGAGTAMRVIEFEHALAPGVTNATMMTIPSHSQVIGVTGRVLVAVSGEGVGSWRIGVPGADNRYGSGLGIAANSYLVGLSGSPVAYYSPTPLLLTAEGGSFASGSVRLAVHLLTLAPPRAI